MISDLVIAYFNCFFGVFSSKEFFMVVHNNVVISN